MTNRLASVRTSSIGAEGLSAALVCLAAVSRVSCSAGRLEIEVVIPDHAENRADGVSAALPAINLHDNCLCLWRRLKVDSDRLPVIGAGGERLRRAEHSRAVCRIQNCKRGRSATLQIFRAHIKF